MPPNTDSDHVPKEIVQTLVQVVSGNADLRSKLQPTRELLSIAQQEGRVALEITCLRILGNIYQDLGNLRYSHAFRLGASELVTVYAAQLPPQISAEVEIDLGRSYIEAKDWGKAETHTLYAQVEAGKVQDFRKRSNLEILIANNLSVVYSQTDRTFKAIEVLELALPAAEGAYLLGLIHLNLAAYYLNELRLSKSQEHARQAQQYAELSQNPMHRAGVELLLGGLAFRVRALRSGSQDSPDAMKHFENTLSLARALNNPVLTAEAEVEIALLNERNGRVSEAGHRFRAALEALEQVRSGLGYEQFQLAFFSSVQKHYEQAISFQLRYRQIELAFQTLERLRSRLLLALLGNRRWDLSDWTENERATLQEILARYGAMAVQQMIGQLAGGAHENSAQPASGAQKENEKAATGLTRARQDFLNLYNAQRVRRVDWLGRQSPPIAGLKELQHLLAPHEALISFLCANDALVIFSLTQDDAHFQQLQLSYSRLEEEVNVATEAMAKLQEEVLNPVLEQQWFKRLSAAAWPKELLRRFNVLTKRLDRLFALLVAPILPAIATRTHWIIIPNGPLHRVPWAALHSREGYLVETRTLSLLPSASIGAALAKAAPRQSGEVIAFGDPDADSPLHLAAARQEVEGLQQAFPEKSQLFFGSEATKYNFLKLAPRARLLHLACHHWFDVDAPLLSFLKLAGDQFLFVFEIADLEFQADLVTLSACESGRSRVSTGDEQFGAVRSFLAAGASRVISTLWPIEDRSARIFFGYFYRRAQQLPLSDALAETQRRMLKLPAYQLPCFWAPFALAGNWRNKLAV